MSATSDPLLTAEEAAAYLGISLPSLYTAVTRRGLESSLRKGKGKLYRKSVLDLYRVAHPITLPAEEVPEGWVTLRQLGETFTHLRRATQNDKAFFAWLWRGLKIRGCPCRRVRLTANSPALSVVYPRGEAEEALRSYAPRYQTPSTENHLIATPAILRSVKWVTCKRAGEIIGCSHLEIQARAAKYSFKAYLHPQSKKLLVNWLEVKEKMKWRTASYISTHLGAAGLCLVKRTCAVKRGEHGAIYFVPELLGAGLKKARLPRKKSLTDRRESDRIGASPGAPGC